MIHIDRYKNFKELASSEREGVDYQVVVASRGSAVTILAPHGGGIEPGTSEIAKAIAGTEFSLYGFEGWKPSGNYESLHITGVHFDEPRCLELLTQCQVVVAVHGCDSDDQRVYVGGLEEKVKRDLIKVLMHAGFDAIEDDTSHSGRDVENICNRCSTRKGIQLEITEGLRRAMFKGWRRRERENVTEVFNKFVAALRGLLLERLESNHKT
jgi:phage replication-related protein YjqB (UPF0714/DUF867 family)